MKKASGDDNDNAWREEQDKRGIPKPSEAEMKSKIAISEPSSDDSSMADQTRSL